MRSSKSRSPAAATPSAAALLDRPLAGLIEYAQLARGAHEVGELVEQPGARTVERADPGSVQDLRTKLGPACAQLRGDPLPQLLRRAVVERDGQNPIRTDALLDQPAEAFGRCEGLACPGSGGDQKRPLSSGVRDRRLLGAERDRARRARGAHSGGAPPSGHSAQWGQLPKRVTHVPASSLGAGSKWPALMRAIASTTIERLRSRSSVVKSRSRYSFRPAARPTLKMACRMPPHTQTFGYQRERKRGEKPSC